MIVKGKTKTGRKFRPSAWIEMLACNYATIDRGRITWNHTIFPGVFNDEKALCLTDTVDPAIENFVRNFAKLHDLIIED